MSMLKKTKFLTFVSSAAIIVLEVPLEFAIVTDTFANCMVVSVQFVAFYFVKCVAILVGASKCCVNAVESVSLVSDVEVKLCAPNYKVIKKASACTKTFSSSSSISNSSVQQQHHHDVTSRAL